MVFLWQFPCKHQIDSSWLRTFCHSRLLPAAFHFGRPLLYSQLSHHQVFHEVTRRAATSICQTNNNTTHPFEAIRARLQSVIGLDPTTVGVALKQCRGKLGLQIHGLVLSSGLDAYVMVSNSLVNMYAKSGSFDLALKIFSSMQSPDIVSWNSILSGFTCSMQALEFAVDMHRTGLPLDPVTFTTTLSLAADLQDLESVQQYHCLVLKSGFYCDIFVGNALITAYSRSSCLCEATRVFEEKMVRDLVSWNSLLCGLTQEVSYGLEAIQLFLRMIRGDVGPDRISFATVISACGHEGFIGFGCQVQGFATKVGLNTHVQVANVLMAMYYKHGDVHSAKKTFQSMEERDVISWTTLISMDSKNAVSLFNEMKMDGVMPNHVTFIALMYTVTSEHSVREGEMIHSVCFRMGISADVNVSNSLITMYAKLKSMEEARKAFESMNIKDIVSWNALFSGYAQNKQCEEALELFSSLMLYCQPNEFTFGSILSAITAAQTVSLTYGQICHCCIVKLGFSADEHVSGALIDMYAKHGCIQDAHHTFEQSMAVSKTVHTSLISWTAIISAHAKHGNYSTVMNLFEDMMHMGVRPDHVTFLAVLVACNCKGMVDMGHKIFESMVHEYEIEPWPEHYACIVDMLGKAGRLVEAEKFLRLTQSQPGISALQSLLGACRMYGDTEMGMRVAGALMEIEPLESGAYVLMSNICADKGDWENVANIRKEMRQRGVKKEVGFSWVDVGVKNSIYMYKFSSGDNMHPLAEEIYSMARSLRPKMSELEEDLDMDLVAY